MTYLALSEIAIAKVMLLATVVVWSSIGVFRYYIPMDVILLIASRAVLGTLFLGAVLVATHRALDWSGLRRNAKWLLVAGVFFCLDWTFLFKAYQHTTVAVAVVCYYMAPIFVMLLSPWILKETLRLRQGVGIVIAFVGILFVSGLFEGGNVAGVTLEGVSYGLVAAALYATVVFLNKRMAPMDPMTKTIAQLVMTAILLTPYCWSAPWPAADTLTPLVIALIVVVGVVHTGLAYAVYFGCMDKLPAQTVVLYSYLDPILAVLLSAFALQEPMSIGTIMGTVLILGGAFIGEMHPRRQRAEAR